MEQLRRATTVIDEHLDVLAAHKRICSFEFEYLESLLYDQDPALMHVAPGNRLWVIRLLIVFVFAVGGARGDEKEAAARVFEVMRRLLDERCAKTAASYTPRMKQLVQQAWKRANISPAEFAYLSDLCAAGDPALLAITTLHTGADDDHLSLPPHEQREATIRLELDGLNTERACDDKETLDSLVRLAGRWRREVNATGKHLLWAMPTLAQGLLSL